MAQKNILAEVHVGFEIDFLLVEPSDMDMMDISHRRQAFQLLLHLQNVDGFESDKYENLKGFIEDSVAFLKNVQATYKPMSTVSRGSSQ